MASTENQGVWFGVSMFLMGLIAGVILAMFTGNLPMSSGGSQVVNAPTAPTAPSAPTQPTASAEVRMVAYAKDIGVDESKFKACVAQNTYTTTQPYACTSGDFCSKINQEEGEGQTSGVNGTPGIIIYDMKTKKARLVSGARPAADFQKQIDEMLKDPSAASTDPSVPAATSVVPVDFSKDHFQGDKSAPLAIIEYSDYQCPFCHRVHPTMEQILSQNKGKVVWVLRHFPLNFHPEALPLAIGAECVNQIGGSDAYWKFTDKVMSEQ